MDLVAAYPMLLTQDFDFYLPPERIAIKPLSTREEAKLLIVDRKKQTWEHATIKDLLRFVLPNDLWIFNNTKVIPARLTTVDQKVEILLLEETSPQHWLCLTKPGKKTRAQTKLQFQSHDAKETLTAEVLQTLESGERVVRFHRPFDLNLFGQIPLPHYIEQQRKILAQPYDKDKERYQTVFAQYQGSVAAPTAGFHFTSAMLEHIPHAFVTLHVGLGTFRPVKTEKVQDHVMHEERFSIPKETLIALEQAQRRVAVGTTSCRVLETFAQTSAQQGKTNLFIYPPYPFQLTDVLVTNFHLPRSSLLMLVSAFLEMHSEQKRFLRGIDFLKAIYQDAIDKGYRFYSYGDAMLIF